MKQQRKVVQLPRTAMRDLPPIVRNLLRSSERLKTYDEKPARFVEPRPLRVLIFGDDVAS